MLFISEKQEKQIVIIDGVLSTRDTTKQIINTISKWTDAFIVTVIFLSVIRFCS
jgi:orotate phosphoribosyltransferase-like protein